MCKIYAYSLSPPCFGQLVSSIHINHVRCLTSTSCLRFKGSQDPKSQNCRSLSGAATSGLAACRWLEKNHDYFAGKALARNTVARIGVHQSIEEKTYDCCECKYFEIRPGHRTRGDSVRAVPHVPSQVVKLQLSTPKGLTARSTHVDEYKKNAAAGIDAVGTQ